MTVHVNVRPSDPQHGPIAQLLITWSPLSVILLAYAAARWISAPLSEGAGADTNRLGFGLHVDGPARIDQDVFGVVPSVWLQERLVDGSVHWYDAVAAVIYGTHFVSIPLVTGVVWFCLRDRFVAWVGAVVVFTAVGVGGYVVYPAAPPWMASDRGEIGTVERISSLGWEYLHLDPVATLTVLGQKGSNPVAAMPSLHAGSALLVALFFWTAASTAWRASLLGYAMLMALTLIYTGEHYVVDVFAGWLTAAIAIAAAAALHRHRAARQPHSDTQPRRPEPAEATRTQRSRPGPVESPPASGIPDGM